MRKFEPEKVGVMVPRKHKKTPTGNGQRLAISRQELNHNRHRQW
jgi:hypothetical protein